MRMRQRVKSRSLAASSHRLGLRRAVCEGNAGVFVPDGKNTETLHYDTAGPDLYPNWVRQFFERAFAHLVDVYSVSIGYKQRRKRELVSG